MQDFSHNIYKKLLTTIIQNNYNVLTFRDYVLSETINYPVLVIRHDIDAKPERALEMAEIESRVGIKASYYFRMKTAQSDIIRQIAAMGHEIGYHYEDLTENKGNTEKAIADFAENLSFLRQFYPVETIAMHGSPLSCCNNLDLWKNYDYKNYGIIAEPYIYLKEKAVSEDAEYYYLTDTARCWNGDKYNVRDRISGCKNGNSLQISATADLINFLSSKKNKENTLNKYFFMITLHPQRWTNNFAAWTVEFICQKLKNNVKRFMKRRVYE